MDGGAKLVRIGRFEIPVWRRENPVYSSRGAQPFHSTMLSRSLPSPRPKMFLPRSPNFRHTALMSSKSVKPVSIEIIPMNIGFSWYQSASVGFTLP